MSKRPKETIIPWFFASLMVLALVGAFMYAQIRGTLLDRLMGWLFLTSAFVYVLIAAVPQGRAKILANAKVPVILAKGIGKLGRSEGEKEAEPPESH